MIGICFFPLLVSIGDEFACGGWLGAVRWGFEHTHVINSFLVPSLHYMTITLTQGPCTNTPLLMKVTRNRTSDDSHPFQDLKYCQRTQLLNILNSLLLLLVVLIRFLYHFNTNSKSNPEGTGVFIAMRTIEVMDPRPLGEACVFGPRELCSALVEQRHMREMLGEAREMSMGSGSIQPGVSKL